MFLFQRIFDRLVGSLNSGNRPFLLLASVGKAILSLLRTELLELNTYEDITKRLLSVCLLLKIQIILFKYNSMVYSP